MNATSSRVALLHYSSRNLGDDIQTFAVRQFIDTDLSINRDALRGQRDTRDLVLYGWLLQSRQWPPPACLRIHPLSIHAATRARPLLTRHIDWWRKRGVIPCRDASTAEFFLNHSIEARVEGCVSLSLRRWVEREAGCVVLADLPAGKAKIPRLDFPRVLRSTHYVGPLIRKDPKRRAQAARAALEKYQRAELVITTRLHAMLPCLALGTPVVYVPEPTQALARQYTRLLDYLPYVETWDGERSYAAGGLMPVNHRPTALISRVTERLKALQSRFTVAVS